MLQFFDVTRDASWFPQVKALYESAFPANERIPIKHLLDDKIKREFWAFFDGDMFCGFSNAITHGSITNIVYFAVVPELRSRGYGSKILQAIRRQHPDTRIVVDIEVEEDSKDAVELERRNRRREFYTRNGFDASPVDYVWQGEHYRLLSAGGPVTEKEFRDFWKEILKDIPGAKYP
ncbi:Ribosomal protein S18 acetylase RimI [Fibrobacter sp. UWB15]|uniref:GNAT family N-acetyltransferase n=1 Tax=unclassified Fibrobacter TaxID=2634177 RepID=UPI000921F1FA|nr:MULTISPECIES: GNAT family N-acetyltransferase [unclassified Fibrobacter]PWJ64982.1 ribosomal protein S18 acetylase RimI-like enzyme [Fibrobacter sp. UWB6]SHG12352.1 Ribosomal protein S18 acetylase RimI [Fibrobacter sp. UWB8]SMG29920.1 Ribosomal protein S18 acetylase RimI [Fibrobacter sp. UWB15]